MEEELVIMIPDNETSGNVTGLEGLNLGDKSEPLYLAFPMTFIYALILIAGVIGNVCTCVVIARNKSMHTATNYYLFSLAVSDLLLLIMGLPQEILQVWMRYPYIFGEFFCIFRGLTSETSTNASILTITSFTVERYLAICHPLRAQTMSKLSRAVKFIIAAWILAAVFATPLVVQFGIVVETHNGVPVPEATFCTVKNQLEHAFETSTFLFFFLPMTIISVLYVLIGLELRESSSMARCAPAAPAVISNGWHRSNSTVIPAKRTLIPKASVSYRQASSSRRAVVKMLVAVVVAFFVCWAPFHAQRLMAVYATERTPLNVIVFNALTYVSGISYYLSATINPILYSIMSLKFRHAFRDTLARCFGRKGTHRQRSFISGYNSTIRSTDFTMVSECNHVDRESKSFRSKTPPRVFHIRHRTDADASRKPLNSTSDSSAQAFDDNVYDETDLSDYIAKMRSTRG